MKGKYFFTSLTRTSNLKEVSFSVEPLPREEWETGDYVVGEVDTPPRELSHVELASGRIVEVIQGDQVMGAFGKRYATLAAVGDWQDIEDDLRMEVLTMAGLFGKVASQSEQHISLTYTGHVLVDGEKTTMSDFVPPTPERTFELPVVLLMGTSMSAGKTSSAKAIVRLLEEAGLQVIGAKLAGAASYSDTLGMQDAGADITFDFVDAGLPSTAVPEEDYRRALRNLLARMADIEGADVLVAEVGASPLEPYNGAAAIEELGPNVRCTVLSATDPYAVTGMIEAFGGRPDLVTGLATSTQAGIDLVEKLSGITAVNVLDQNSLPKLKEILEDALDL